MAPDVQGDDDIIPHQSLVEQVIVSKIATLSEDNEAIDDLVAITGGQSPTEAEFNTAQDTINGILAALREVGIIPAE